MVGAGGDDAGRIDLSKTMDHAHTEANGMAVAALDRFQRAVPARAIDADRPDLDTMLAGIANDLRRRIKAHGLRVQKGRAEGVGIVAFHVG